MREPPLRPPLHAATDRKAENVRGEREAARSATCLEQYEGDVRLKEAHHLCRAERCDELRGAAHSRRCCTVSHPPEDQDDVRTCIQSYGQRQNDMPHPISQPPPKEGQHVCADVEHPLHEQLLHQGQGCAAPVLAAECAGEEGRGAGRKKSHLSKSKSCISTARHFTANCTTHHDSEPEGRPAVLSTSQTPSQHGAVSWVRTHFHQHSCIHLGALSCAALHKTQHSEQDKTTTSTLLYFPHTPGSITH